MNPSHRGDMFELLSDHIVFIILSFLPFKDAARTSVLSQRWRNLWLNTRKIEFYESVYVNHGDSDENKAVQRRVFMDFVRQWISNYREPTISEFHLSLSNPNDVFNQDLLNCISFAINRDVKVLSLDFSNPSWIENDVDENPNPVFTLPDYVYGHKILEYLKLFSCNFQVIKLIDFRVLKNISLGWMALSLTSIKSLLENCPSLEAFAMKKCWNIEHLDISLPNLKLKSLIVDKCTFGNVWIQFEAPNLEYFKYSGYVGHFDIDVKPCMEEADLDFEFETTFEEIGVLLYNIIDNLYPIRVLTVCSYMLQVLPTGEEPLAMTYPLHLRKLTLNTALRSTEFCGIAFLLKSSPLLKFLTINIVRPIILPDYKFPYKFTGFDIVFKCLLKSLRIVEVNGFTGSYNQIYLLTYLITDGRKLEKITIQVSNEENAKGGNRFFYLEKARELNALNKRSRRLQIEII